MNAVDTELTKFLAAEAQYYVPIYQRKYSWKKEHCLKLLEDILKIAKDQGRPCHFIGSVIYLAQDNAQHAAALKEYLVIDGQQRLTTVSIILLALGDYTRERFGGGEEYYRSATNLEKLSKRYIINEDEPVQSDTYYKIRLNAEDFFAWKKLISERKKPDEIRRSKIFENYDILMKALRESGAEPQLVYDGIKKLRLVDICLVPEDNAQLVFETVNSTGLPLTTADKIRNFLLMTVDTDTQSQLYTDYWHPMELDLGMESGSTATFESFFYYYMTVMLQKPISGDYYDLFKDYYFDNKVQGTAAIVKQIRQYSKYFIQWQTAKEDGNRIHCLLCRIRGAGQWKFTPAVLKLLADWNDGLISEADTEEILTIMESYLMRRAVCAFPTNTAGPVSLSMLKSLFPPARTEDLARFDHLKSFKRNISSLTWAQRMPKDEEVIKILQTLPMYSNNSSRTKMLLDKLENYGQKQSTHVASYTIEHIMPQTLSDEWKTDLGADWERVHETYLHTLGNLTLTGYNPEYGNKRFADKLSCRDRDGNPIGYLHSPIHLSVSVASCSQWGETEIINRANFLARKVCEIWPYPQ